MHMLTHNSKMQHSLNALPSPGLTCKYAHIGAASVSSFQTMWLSAMPGMPGSTFQVTHVHTAELYTAECVCTAMR